MGNQGVQEEGAITEMKPGQPNAAQSRGWLFDHFPFQCERRGQIRKTDKRRFV